MTFVFFHNVLTTIVRNGDVPSLNVRLGLTYVCNVSCVSLSWRLALRSRLANCQGFNSQVTVLVNIITLRCGVGIG